jgi:hypothetical protein
MLWWVYGGMCSTVGNPSYLGEIEANTEEQALRLSWDAIVDEYESYAGLYGIPSWEDIEDEVEVECDREDPDFESWVNDRYQEEVSNWTVHWVRPAIEGADPEDYVEEER